MFLGWWFFTIPFVLVFAYLYVTAYANDFKKYKTPAYIINSVFTTTVLAAISSLANIPVVGDDTPTGAYLISGIFFGLVNERLVSPFNVLLAVTIFCTIISMIIYTWLIRKGGKKTMALLIPLFFFMLICIHVGVIVYIKYLH